MFTALMCALAGLGVGTASDECILQESHSKAEELAIDLKAMETTLPSVEHVCLYADPDTGIEQLNDILLTSFKRIIPQVEKIEKPFVESCPYTVMYRVYSAGADINGIRLFAFYKGIPIMTDALSQKRPLTVDRFHQMGQSFMLHLRDNPLEQVRDKSPEALEFPEAFDRLDDQKKDE